MFAVCYVQLDKLPENGPWLQIEKCTPAKLAALGDLPLDATAACDGKSIIKNRQGTLRFRIYKQKAVDTWHLGSYTSQRARDRWRAQINKRNKADFHICILEGHYCGDLWYLRVMGYAYGIKRRLASDCTGFNLLYRFDVIIYGTTITQTLRCRYLWQWLINITFVVS